MNLPFVNELFSLEGSIAVVTGAGSGIGQAAAIALANFGAEVLLLGRTLEKLKKTENEISKAGGTSKCYKVDISNAEQVRSFFDSFKREYEQLDIFVSNAGYNVREDALNTTEEEFDGLINTNLKGAWRCLKYAGEIMKKQRSGNVVIVTSINGLHPTPNQAIYASTKFALQGLMQSLAATLAPYGVRVNSCAPGAVLTDLTKDIFSVKSVYDAKVAGIPLGFIGQPMDIGAVIASMASGAYRFMTGATILLDGGESLKSPMKMPDGNE
ncbi:MAG: SDR family oxidoreductase [Treponema sp.]|jgi:NAD(P)-dependent dehydrogenase (short-subunit alcohol dehydrogenase family)|nr:SDR family oxidoreductase [Treponema sp.]